MLLSLILYGSRARGDHRLSSDVDLLGVVDEGRIHREVAARGASLYNYPINTLIEKSEEGDLFLLHLVTEGVVLHDTALVFERVREAFSYKSSYENEIEEASAIIWYLAERPSSLNFKRARKRMVWALRTILIASAAQAKEAVFSSSGLERFSRMAGLKKIIDRRFTIEGSELQNVALDVVLQFGKSKKELGFSKSTPIDASEIARFGALAASAPGLLKIRKTKLNYE